MNAYALESYEYNETRGRASYELKVSDPGGYTVCTASGRRRAVLRDFRRTLKSFGIESPL